MQFLTGSNQLDAGWVTKITYRCPKAHYTLISILKITPLGTVTVPKLTISGQKRGYSSFSLQILLLFWENTIYPDDYSTLCLNSSHKTTQSEFHWAAHLPSMPTLPLWVCTSALLNYSLLPSARPAHESFLISQEPSPRLRSQLAQMVLTTVC